MKKNRKTLNYFRIFCISFVYFTAAFLMTGCGSDNDKTTSGHAQLELSADPPGIYANGYKTTTINVKIRDANNNPVKDPVTVRFNTTSGTLEQAEADSFEGIASVKLTAPKSPDDDSATVTASINIVDSKGIEQYIEKEVKVSFLGVSLSYIKAIPADISADGFDTSTITVRLTDADNNPVEGEKVEFEPTEGTIISENGGITNSDGIATATLTGSANYGTGTVTAIFGLTCESVNVSFTCAIKSVEVISGSSEIPADGQSNIRVRAFVKDRNGAFVKDGTLVSFETTAGTILRAGTDTVVETAETVNGIAAVDLLSSRNVGRVTVTAMAGEVSGTVNVEFITGPVHKITLSADPDKLNGDGTSTSTIRAQVTDLYENAVDGEIIIFSITEGNGRLSSPTATTSQGVASVAYTASLTAGIVKISAKATNGVVADEPAVIALAPACWCPPWIVTADKTEVTVVLGHKAGPENKTMITAILRDRKENSIPGVPITFRDVTNVITVDIWPYSNIVRGKNKGTTPSFYTKGGNTTFIMTNTAALGWSIVVWLRNIDMGQRNLIYNTISPVTDEIQTESLDPGTYYLEVDAVDDWIIEVQGDVKSVPEGIVLDVVDTKDNGETDDNGQTLYTAEYEYTTDKIAKIVVIRVESEGMTSEDIIIKQKSGPPFQIEMSAERSEIYANSYETSGITAIVRDENDNLAEDPVEVVFDADEGIFKNQASYKLTERSFEKLGQEGVPQESVLDRTESLKDMEYESREEFTDALEYEIGNSDLSDQYIPVFLKHAGIIKIMTVAGNAAIYLKAPARSSEDGDSLARITGTIIIPGTETQKTAATSVNLLGVSLSDMIVSPASIYANGTDESVITIRLKDKNGVAVPGKRIDFFIKEGTGTLKKQNSLTDDDGIATTVFVAPVGCDGCDYSTSTIEAKFGLAADSPSISKGISFIW